MSTKRIEMILHHGNSQVTIREEFDEDAPWHALAYQFACFLKAQGFHVSEEDIGYDVESYVRNVVKDEVRF